MTWLTICSMDRLQPERGAAALLPDGTQIALFRLADESLYALGNTDPFSGANVLSRGILGDRGGTVMVASPVYKQAFDLSTGVCLDDPTVRVPTFAVRCRDGHIEVHSHHNAEMSP